MPFTFFLPSPPLDHRNVPGGPPAGSRDDLAGGAAAVQDPALDSMRAFWWGELTTMWRKHERERESLQKHVNESICNKRRRRTSYHYNWLLGPTGPHLPRSSTVLKQKKLQHASLDAPVLYHLQGYCYTCAPAINCSSASKGTGSQITSVRTDTTDLSTHFNFPRVTASCQGGWWLGLLIPSCDGHLIWRGLATRTKLYLNRRKQSKLSHSWFAKIIINNHN